MRDRLFLVTIMAALAASALLAQKVSYDFDKTADFSRFKSFTFKPGTRSGNPLVDQRVESAIDASPTSRGMTRNDSTPDLVVVTHLTFEKSKDISTYSTAPFYGGYGWGWGGGWGSTEVRVHDILTGTLVIDLVDVAKATLVWRGIGEKEVKPDPKPESVDKNVSKAVTKIFKNYPPGRPS